MKLMKAVAYARYHGITHLLAVGGGSVVDGTNLLRLQQFVSRRALEIVIAEVRQLKKHCH